jgi:hypothetical protein
MKCRIDIKEGLIKQAIDKYETKNIARTGKNTLFVSNTAFRSGKTQAYQVAQNTVNRINKEYEGLMAHRREVFNGQEILIDPSNNLVSIYYNDYLKAFPGYTESKPLAVKTGVKQLFESNPELAKIGTPEQYSQYLDTIFPDSKVKDIVYRGDTSKQINNRGLKDFLKGVRTDLLYLTTNADVAKNELYRSDYSEFIYKKDDKGNLSLTSEDKEDETKGLVRGPKNFFAAIVNLKNPIIKDAKNQSYKDYKIEDQYELDILKNAREKIKNKEADSLIIKNVLEGTSQNIQSTTIGIRLPEQIHILGNNNDIEGFKEFVSLKSSEEDARKIQEEDAKRAGIKYGDRYMFEEERPDAYFDYEKELLASTDTPVEQNIFEELSNLNFTNEVIEYLYNDSSKRLSIEKFAETVKMFAANLRGMGYTNEEVLEHIKCL